MNPKISLKLIPRPEVGHVLDAPPVLKASNHSIDYTCGKCGTILMHADARQVFGLMIRCLECDAYNATES